MSERTRRAVVETRHWRRKGRLEHLVDERACTPCSRLSTCASPHDSSAHVLLIRLGSPLPPDRGSSATRVRSAMDRTIAMRRETPLFLHVVSGPLPFAPVPPLHCKLRRRCTPDRRLPFAGRLRPRAVVLPLAVAHGQRPSRRQRWLLLRDRARRPTRATDRTSWYLAEHLGVRGHGAPYVLLRASSAKGVVSVCARGASRARGPSLLQLPFRERGLGWADDSFRAHG